MGGHDCAKSRAPINVPVHTFWERFWHRHERSKLGGLARHGSPHQTKTLRSSGRRWHRVGVTRSFRRWRGARTDHPALAVVEGGPAAIDPATFAMALQLYQA